ncbi:MAG: PEP-CTERM sorting domain-containing protein [Verrucomicrobia bacterium]|nr:PEP-CTERM sorting domain-containing protein [Verrucomicrobiota bacterium]
MKTQHHSKTGRLFLSACLLFATVCVSTSTAQIVYDDFSSGNLDKWSVDAWAGNTYSIASSILTLKPSATPAYGYSTYTSTKTDFSLARSTGNATGSFFVMPANAFIRTVADGGTYEEFNFGIKAGSDTLNGRILWNLTSSIFDIQNNGSLLARAFQGDLATINSAGKRFAFEWDGTTASINLYSALGVNEGIFVSIPFSAPSFGTSGSIYFQFNTPPGVATSEASISMDSFGVVPEPSTAILAASGLLGLLACARRRRK